MVREWGLGNVRLHRAPAIHSRRFTAGGGGGGVTVVQSRVATSASSLAFLNPVTAGNTIAVCVTGWVASISAISDSVNGAHTIISNSDASNMRCAMSYRTNTGAGTPNISLTGSGDRTLVIVELAGVDTGSPIDITGANANGSGTTVSASATGTMSAAGNGILAVMGHDGGNISIVHDTADGFSLVQEAEDGGSYMDIAVQFLQATSTASITPNWTIGSSQNWIAGRAVFRAA